MKSNNNLASTKIIIYDHEESINSWPPEIVSEIIKFLPTKSFISARMVSSEWYLGFHVALSYYTGNPKSKILDYYCRYCSTITKEPACILYKQKYKTCYDCCLDVETCFSCGIQDIENPDWKKVVYYHSNSDYSFLCVGVNIALRLEKLNKILIKANCESYIIHGKDRNEDQEDDTGYEQTWYFFCNKCAPHAVFQCEECGKNCAPLGELYGGIRVKLCHNCYSKMWRSRYDYDQDPYIFFEMDHVETK